MKKRILPIILVCVMLLSVAVFAEESDYAQDPADLQSMAEYIDYYNDSYGSSVALSDQFFTVEFTGTTHHKYELKTNQGEVSGFFCLFADMLKDEVGLSAMPMKNSMNGDGIVSFSNTEAFELVPNAGTDLAFLLEGGGQKKIGFCVTSPVTQETEITLTVYGSSSVFPTENASVQKTVTFTAQPPAVSSDAVRMEIDCEDRNTASPNAQVYAGDEVTVRFDKTALETTANLTFTYDANVFEVVQTPDGWTKTDSTYTCSATASTDLGAFQFQAKAQTSDNSAGEFSLQIGDAEPAKETVTVIYKTIQYTIKDLEPNTTGNAALLPYNGAEQGIVVDVTDPAEGSTIQYQKGAYDSSGSNLVWDDSWTDQCPTLKETGAYIMVKFKITAPGYKEATDTVWLEITEAQTPVDPEPDPDPVRPVNPMYAVSAASNVTGGTIKLSPRYAQKGDTVTITATPDKGYMLGKLTVTDNKGNTVKLTSKGGDKYTFVMPRGGVTVDAKFVPAVSFEDVSRRDYFYDAVNWAVENGITTGTSDSRFSPDAPCTRAQVVTFLWRAAGSPKVSGGNPFADVSTSDYYYDAVLWAVREGITVGTGDGKFSPDATVTRGQTAAFLHRAAGEPAAYGSSFTDVAATAYYADAVSWAAREGITGGTGDGKFSPDAPCTRAQIVTFLYRQYA